MSRHRARTRVRGRRIMVAAAVAALAVTGAAAAHWAGSGEGAGAASSGATQPVTLSPATPVAQLYPGGRSSVRLTVTNPNTATVRVDALGLDATQGTGGFAVDAGHGECGLSSLSVTTDTNGGAGWTIPGGGAVTLTLADALAMHASAANACQGATFTVHLRGGT
jgi:hypothetical protein